MAGNRIAIIASLILICAIAFLLYPFEQTIAPEWEVRVVDQEGKPIAHIVKVTEFWEQYSLEENSHYDEKYTNAYGRVHFGRRTHQSSLGSRFIGCLGQYGRYGVHASCGPRSFLVAVAGGYEMDNYAGVRALQTELQESTLVMKQR